MSTSKSVNFKFLLLYLLSLTSWASSIDINIGFCIRVINGTCPHRHIQFRLFTRKNPTEAQIIGTGNITSSNFNPNLPTKILIHGFTWDCSEQWFEDMGKEYLLTGDYNVIAVAWCRLSTFPCYFITALNAEFVGKCTAQFVKSLREKGNSSIHLIGLSVGAHLAGFVSNYLKPDIPDRITGLDPAWPMFVTNDKDRKLDASDAKRVDCIHTNTILASLILPCGDADFYLNGGSLQPGCFILGVCNHLRSIFYFTESINSEKGFYVWPCDPVKFLTRRICPPSEPQILMGEHFPRNARGIYAGITASHPPFALGPMK